MKEVTDSSTVADFLEVSLASFQNLSADEKDHIAKRSKEIVELKAPPTFKSMALGFLFLNLAGEENFLQVMKNLKGYLATATQAPPPQKTPPP